MTIKAKVRRRPIAPVLPPAPPAAPGPAAEELPMVSAPACPAPQASVPRVYWGDRVGVRFWTLCVAILGGMLVYELLLAIVSLFR